MNQNDRLDLLQGTLDMLVLRTLVLGPQHGQAIGRSVLGGGAIPVATGGSGAPPRATHG